MAGGTAALRLTQSGHQCTIFERTPTPQTIGGAVNIAPNGLRLLDRLGVYPQVKAAGCIVPSFELRSRSGSLLGAVSNKSTDGYAGIRIMRSALQRVLLNEARERGVAIRFGKSLQSVAEESTGEARSEKPTRIIATFSDGSTATADLLIGADGIHSTVRTAITESTTPGAVDPQYTGTALVYGLLSQDDIPEVDFSKIALTSGAFVRTGFFFTCFTDNSLSKLYWVAGKAKAKAEKLHDTERIRSEALTDFGDLYFPIPRIISRTTEFFSWPVYELPVLANWVRGNIALVGDAAHALPPNQGQGVSQAFEDVFVLAKVVDSAADLRRYQEIRMPRIAKMRQRIRSTRRERERGPWELWVREWLFWLLLNIVGRLIDWWGRGLFDYDPDTECI